MMKGIIAAFATALAMTILIAGCGAGTPASEHKGFYDMQRLAKNIEGGIEESPGPGHVVNMKCVSTGKSTALCEDTLRSESEEKQETATITINPEGTRFIVSHREESTENR